MTKQEFVKKVMEAIKKEKEPKHNTWTVDVLDEMTRLVVATRTGLKYGESFKVAKKLLEDLKDEHFYCRIVSRKDVCDVRFVKIG